MAPVSSFIKKYANHYKICTFHLLRKVSVSAFTSEVQWLRWFLACRLLIVMYACADVLGLHLILVTCNTNIACGEDRMFSYVGFSCCIECACLIILVTCIAYLNNAYRFLSYVNTWSAQYSLQCPKRVLQLVISVQLTLLHLVYNTHHNGVYSTLV